MTPDAIVVTVLRPQADEGKSVTIAIDEIATIEQLRGSTLRKVLVGIAVAVLVGTCAVALNSESPQPVTTNEVPQRPIPSDRP